MKYITTTGTVRRMASDEALTVQLAKPTPDQPTPDAKPPDVIQFLLFNLAPTGLTAAEVRQGGRIFDAIEAAEKAGAATFELQDSDYDWLKKRAQEQGPRLFGMNANRLFEIIDNATDTPPTRDGLAGPEPGLQRTDPDPEP